MQQIETPRKAGTGPSTTDIKKISSLASHKCSDLDTSPTQTANMFLSLSHHRKDFESACAAF